MKILKSVIFIIGLLISPVARAQEFSFVKFGKAEGLNHSQVVDMAQDNAGNLWLGTFSRSIYRFDGRGFTEHKITPEGFRGTLYALKIQPDNHEQIWILSNAGLVCFNGASSKIIPASGQPRFGGGSDIFFDVNDSLWVIDNKGDVFTLLGDSLKLRKDIRHRLPNVLGYFMNTNGMPTFYDGQGRPLEVGRGGALRIPQAAWTIDRKTHHIYRVSDTLLIASEEGIEQVTPSGSIRVQIPGMKPMDKISSLTQDRKGLIWGIMTGRIFVIDNKKNLHWIDQSSEIENEGFKLIRDKDGNVWISIDVMGIVKHREHAWIKLRETAGLHISAILQREDESMVFGTYIDGIIDNGHHVLKGQRITTMSFAPNGDILAGTLRNGVYQVNHQKSKKLFPIRPMFMDVGGIGVHGDSLLVGTGYGMFIQTPGKGAMLIQRNVPPNERGASRSIVINDTVYYSGVMSGVIKILGDTHVQVLPTRFHHSTVYDIKRLPWGGYSVFGEFPELIMFDDDFKVTQVIDLSAFTASAMVTEFVDRNHIIIGSTDGLFQVQLNDKGVESVKKFGKIDGYQGDEVYIASSLMLKNGKIIIGTVDGAYVFNPQNSAPHIATPTTYLTGVSFRTANQDSLKGYFRLPVNPVLKHNESHITFSFSATNLSNPNNIEFQQRMDGLDDDWSDLSQSQVISYSNLAPGEYVFCVQAVVENRIYGNIARYPFSVQPAFWQTVPFYSGLGITAVIIIIFVIHLTTLSRMRRFKLDQQVRLSESQRLKKQMSMDFHDEMGNRLASMLTQAGMLKLKYPHGELFGFFDFFERHAKALYHGTKDFIWSIDVSSNNLKEVISYLRDFGANYFEGSQIQFHVENEILSDDFNMTLTDGHNRQIILILKEAMTNVLRHSTAQNVHFNAVRIKDYVSLTLRDDGQGLRHMPQGNGLANMKKRASNIKGALNIVSVPLAGTTIMLSLFVEQNEYEKKSS